MSRSLVCVALVFMTAVALAQHVPAAGTEMESEDNGFFVFGAGVGSPAGVCLISGYYSRPIVFHLSGGYWKKGWNGIQGNMGLNLGRNPSFVTDISFVGGRFQADPLNENGEVKVHSVTYAGVAYEMYLSGFYLQAGLAVGRGDYPNPQALIQFGYLIEL